MAHNITIDRAKELFEKEQELQAMQKEGKPLPPSSRRQKKYEMMRKRQDGILRRIKDRIKNTGGTLPEHMQEKKGE